MSWLSASSTRLRLQSAPQIPERLKIGLLSDTFLPVSNGVTHSVAALARLLVQRGHEPHIFTFAPTAELRMAPEGLLDDPPHFWRVPPREGEETLSGVPIHYATALPILETGYFFGVRYPLWMRSLLEEMDVLHVHHPFISGRLARRLRLETQPLVFTNHTRYDIYTHYFQQAVPRQMQSLTEPLTSPETLGRRFAARAARFANACDAVIAPSASMESVMHDWGVRAPVHVVPNGIDLSRFEDSRFDESSTRNGDLTTRAQSVLHTSQEEFPRPFSRQQWRALWEIAANAPVAIYVGRVAPEKNGRVLLEAFARALQKVPRAHLVIVGDGPSIEEWKDWTRELEIESRTVFAGALPSLQIPAVLRAADFFVSSSVSEVHPLTFIEAMASGLPCVGTRSPGVQDTIVAGENGWLAPPDVAGFAAVLIEALRDESERKRRGANAKKSSLEYSMQTNATRVFELYQNVLAARIIG